MNINREFAMPNKSTFTIRPIKKILNKYVDNDGMDWVDPFAGWVSPAFIKNDLNGKHQYTMDAIEFLKLWPDGKFEGILLDPPYSITQISEHYKQAGIDINGWHTSMAWGAELKNQASRILKHKGIAICFGWNSMGLGLKRGFEMIEVLLVPHGGSKNDTIVTVERKIETQKKLFKESQNENV